MKRSKSRSIVRHSSTEPLHQEVVLLTFREAAPQQFMLRSIITRNATQKPLFLSTPILTLCSSFLTTQPPSGILAYNTLCAITYNYVYAFSPRGKAPKRKINVKDLNVLHSHWGQCLIYVFILVVLNFTSKSDCFCFCFCFFLIFTFVFILQSNAGTIM